MVSSCNALLIIPSEFTTDVASSKEEQVTIRVTGPNTSSRKAELCRKVFASVENTQAVTACSVVVPLARSLTPLTFSRTSVPSSYPFLIAVVSKKAGAASPNSFSKCCKKGLGSPTVTIIPGYSVVRTTQQSITLVQNCPADPVTDWVSISAICLDFPAKASGKITTGLTDPISA
jgi:hypothetical protein